MMLDSIPILYKMNKSFVDLKNAIANYDKNIDDEKKKEFFNFLGNTEKGTAIMDLI